MIVNYLEKYGPALVKNGWPLVLLPYKSKKPIGSGWQTRSVTMEEVSRLIKNGKPHGIGIQCGNIVGIDNDYEESETVTEAFLEAIEELTTHYFPDCLHRRGRSTRPALRVIRLEDNEKAKSLNIDKLQILGAGRQFVAYNTHPDTLKPYVWLKDKGLGSPVSVRFEDVPQYSKETLKDFIEGVHLLEETFGLAPENAKDVLRQLKSGERVLNRVPLHADRSLVERACEFIVNDPKWGWEDWNNNIMMPLYNASKGEEWGRELAHQVSAQHDMYDQTVTDERWDQIAKHPADLLGWPRINWLARQEGMPFLGPLDWDNYRYFRDRTDIFDVRAEAWITRTSFEDTFPRQKAKGHGSAVQTFVESRPDQCFYTIHWDPSLPEGSAMIGHKQVWNLWKAPDWFGEKGDVRVWLDLMRRVYEAETELVIKRMAFDIQYIHLRPQWHVLVIGDYGIGKNTSIYPIMEWSKKFNFYSQVGIEDVKDQFNEYLDRKKILVLNELKGIDSGRFNKMKDWLAGTEDMVKINDKHIKKFYVRNVSSWYFNTNVIDPVSLSRNERRLLVCESHARSPKTTAEKAAAVKEYTWVSKNWSHVIWYLKNVVKVDKDFASVLPRRTKAQEQLAEMTAPMYEEVANILPEMINGSKLFTIGDIEFQLLGAGSSLDIRHLNHKTISKALYKIGAMKCNDGQQIKFPNQVRRYIWTFDKELASEKSAYIRQLWEFIGPDDADD